jgi:MoaA/NifB/PqqE/SkfB family radical SAM enzyme
MDSNVTGYFLPDDWILWRSETRLAAVRLSSGEQLEIDAGPDLDIFDQERSHSLWTSLARFEPLLGELRTQLREHSLRPLTCGTVLRGSGWRQLFIELTGQCNEQCIHCYAESSPFRVEALSWPDVSRILVDAKALDFDLVQLTGGDPLISPHCIRAVERANELGIPRVEIYTNGLALRGRLYERLRELEPAFAFSFYSHDPETHDAITRTPGSHVRTARAIRQAVEDGLTVRVGVIAMEQNWDDGPATREFLLGLGVAEDAIRFDRMRNVGRGGVTPKEETSAPEGAHSGTDSYGRRSFGGTAAISYEGTVYPCIFSRHLALGSIRSSSLHDILTSATPLAPNAENLLLARERWSDKLSCWECQTRSALLDGGCRV